MPQHRKLQTIRKSPINLFLAFRSFFVLFASGGVLLLLFSVLAIIWINSDYTSSYNALLSARFSIDFNGMKFDEPLLLWINDGLMAIFFLAVGLEIKREFLAGELSSAKKAVLPLAAAVGGILFPALIYSSFNVGGAYSHDWEIPAATDIAFALGALAILGNRAPLGLQVFLSALAIADALGAVIVIALFYSQSLSAIYIGLSVAAAIVLFIGNRLNIRFGLFYGVIGIILWYLVFNSGIHATVSGVILAMMIPARPRIAANKFASDAQSVLSEIDSENITAGQTQEAAQQLESLCDNVRERLCRNSSMLCSRPYHTLYYRYSR